MISINGTFRYINKYTMLKRKVSIKLYYYLQIHFYDNPIVITKI